MIDWEVGDMTAWMSVDGCKPFPVTIYKKKEQWLWEAHGMLSDADRIKVEATVKDILHTMHDQWRVNMKRRLNWDTTKLKSKKK